MTGMLDPVGPEDARTYWVRRGVVGAAALVVVILVIVMVSSLNSGGSTTGAPPPVSPSGPALQPATPQGAGSTPAPSETPKTSGTPTAPASTSPSAKSSATKNESSKSDPSKKSTKESTKKSTPTSAAPPPACKPADLRTTLTGPRDVKVGKPVTFEAGAINGGSAACTFTLDPKTYEFRIYSGTDRIWSTKDCDAWFPKVSTVLKPEQATTWKIRWTVQRSDGCDFAKTTLRSGTYAANSLLTSAPPAQLVMRLTA